MKSPVRLMLILLLFCPGCLPMAGEGDRDPESRRRYELARALEASGSYREAAHEYSIIGERYAGTTMHVPAVRRAALLFVNPSTSARNDSMAIHWLKVYTDIAPSQAERELAEVLSALVTQRALLLADLARHDTALDSTASTARRAQAAQSGLSRRIGELENELQQTVRELQKVKEIDLRLSRTRKRK